MAEQAEKDEVAAYWRGWDAGYRDGKADVLAGLKETLEAALKQVQAQEDGHGGQ